MKTSTSKRIGRPTTPGIEGKKSTLSIRASANLKDRLNEAAKINGRSLSQEAEARLEQSLLETAYADRAGEIAYGRRLSAALRVLGRILVDTGPVAAARTARSYDDVVNWMSNPFAFDQAAKGLIAAWEALRPAGDITPRDAADAQVGEYMARGVLVALKDRECGGELGDWARPVREALGEIVDRINVNPNAPIMINALPPQIAEGGQPLSGRIVDTHLGRSIGRHVLEDERE